MRTAETVLGIIQERGKRGLPLEEIYRQLYNPDLYLRAYAKLYSNNGAMTPGTTTETVDAMAITKITLANKHKTRVTAMVRKDLTQIETPYGQMKCLEVRVERQGKKPLIAQFGGIPLRRKRTAILTGQQPIYKKFERNELIKRLLADTCELCGSKEQVEVHHIRKLADLNVKGKEEKPRWIQIMAARRRKTLITCRRCHENIHYGEQRHRNLNITGEPDELKGSSPVLRETERKGASN